VAAHLRLPQPEHLDGGADAEDDERGEQQTDGYRRPVRQPEGVARAAVGAVGAGRADKVDALWVHGVVAQPVARPGARVFAGRRPHADEPDEDGERCGEHGRDPRAERAAHLLLRSLLCLVSVELAEQVVQLVEAGADGGRTRHDEVA